MRLKTSLIFGFLCCCVAFPAPAGASGSAALPKIHIDTSHRGFSRKGKPFVPFGVTYYRPRTGWAPQVWTQFDAEATRKDFALMRQQGVNCIRVFLSYRSFYFHPGVLNEDGVRKFDAFLSLAEEAGLYVQPTGPDLWEGPPEGQPTAVEDEATVRALEDFWKLFASRYRGRNIIFSYELKNEPEVGWNGETLRKRWNTWLANKYLTVAALEKAWGRPEVPVFGGIPVPPEGDALNDRRLLDYQKFREDLADEWTRRQVVAIKAADPNALVTVGLIQWSVPSLLPGIIHYSAFRPARQARYLDFLEIHFYPFATGAYEYRSKEDELKNLSYLESVVRETAMPGEPVVLAEFGWYGGGKPRFDNNTHPAATEEQQAEYCAGVVETSASFVRGWLNWGFFDAPEATDCSQFIGLATADGGIKAWGKTFQQLSKRFTGDNVPPRGVGPRPFLDWDACLTSGKAAGEFRQKYYEAFTADRK